ncbi:MAG: beta-glucosidase BglX [Bacteroidota bacterium]
MTQKFFAPFYLAIGLAVLMVACQPASNSSLSPKDARIEARVDSLMALMTLQEKIGQLTQYNGSWDVTGPVPEGGNKRKYDQIKNGDVGSMLNVLSVEGTRKMQQLAVENSRLGIPMIFAYDVIHGYKTMFPLPLAEAASWDITAIERSAAIAAKEASAAGLHWTFAPMVDISRDARWGRVMEGAGEDPFLGSKIAAARVRGFQGSDLSATNTVAACAKHLAAYGFAEGGRDYNTVDISNHTLFNTVLPPFKACADAGVATMMNAFNEVGGVPATASKFLQTDILKTKWGFDGFVVSDWGTIFELVDHAVAVDTSHAAEIAIKAGCDMDMEARAYNRYLKDLVTEGKVDEKLVDEAARRILRLKFRLGLFDDPYKYCDENREKTDIYSTENLEASRDMARKSIVLLKNEGGLLPLKKDLGSVAVIGPLAADKDTPLGSWRAQATANSAVSLLEGIQKVIPANKIRYAKGADLTTGERSFIRELTINETDRSGFGEAIAAAKRSELVVMALGEDAFQSGEGRSQTDISLAGVQLDLLKAVYKANKNVVLILMNGRPLDIRWADANIPTIVEGWHLGSQAGHALADVLFGDYNPSGRLPLSFPRSVGQVPIYYNHKNTGRPGPSDMVFWSHYTDESNDPLYPFGHGLTYTSFEYGAPQLSSTSIGMDDKLQVSVKLTNTGSREGKEVVQLYIRDMVGSLTRPMKELKAFQQIQLKEGESQTVSFQISSEDLRFYTANERWEAEPGKFTVFVGPNARDLQAATFDLVLDKK